MQKQYAVPLLLAAMLLTMHPAQAEDLNSVIKCSDPLRSPTEGCTSARTEPVPESITGLPDGIGAPLSDILDPPDNDTAVEPISSAYGAETSYRLPSRYYTHGVVEALDGTSYQVKIPVIQYLFPGFLADSTASAALPAADDEPDTDAKINPSAAFSEYYALQGGAALFGLPLSPELRDGYLSRYDDLQLTFPSAYQVFQSGIIYQKPDGTIVHAPIGTWLYAKDMIAGLTRDARAGVLIGTVRSSGGTFVGTAVPLLFMRTAFADASVYAAIPDTEIKAINETDRYASSVQTDILGEFLLKVLPGTYTLSVNAREYQPQISTWEAVGGQMHMTDFLLTIAPPGSDPELVTTQPDVLPPVLSGLANMAVVLIAAVAMFIFAGVVILGFMGRAKKTR